MAAPPRRFTSLDLAAAVHELQATVPGTHLQNIYDVDARTFIFKFGGRTNVLFESGMRLHATGLAKENPNVLPSAFAARLRKYVRDRRCTRVRQLGFDRVAEFAFELEARPQASLYLYFELFVAGNIVLVDAERHILAILREVADNSTGARRQFVGATYGEAYVPRPLFAAQWDAAAQASIRNTLKAADVPLHIADACLFRAGVPPATPARALAAAQSQALADALAAVRDSLAAPTDSTFSPAVVETSSAKDYVAICPPATAGVVRPCASFGEAVDAVFLAHTEAQARRAEDTRAANATRRIEHIRAQQQGRMAALRDAMDLHVRCAQRIEAMPAAVDEACRVVRAALANEMSWDDLGALIVAERARGRATARRIARLNLEKSLIVLSLDDPHSSRESGLRSADTPNAADSSKDPIDAPSLANLSVEDKEGVLLVDVDYRLSPSANAQRHYDLRAAAAAKLARSEAAFEAAMASALAHVKTEARAERRRAAAAAQQALIPRRRPLWFERFRWFVSSDGLLVLAGRDAHQNEYIVRRVLRPGDAYLHADVHGAASVVVKAFPAEAQGRSPIPPRTLVEAGAFALCHSRAWDAKIVTSAWWVAAEQVSKTAPTGEYLPAGSFVVRGRKNFLPPAQLVLGFAIVFVVDADSAERRRQLRLARQAAVDAAGPSASAEEPVDDTYLQLISPEVLEQTDTTINVSSARQPRGAKHARQPEPKAAAEAPKNAKKDKRGKKAKGGRYADQDPEERRLRQALVGNVAAKPAAAAEQAQPVPQKPRLPRPAPEAAEEDSPITEDELTLVDAIVANPGPEDVVLNAVAMIAPYAATHDCRFRVKITPATAATKRGVASKTALALMAAHPEIGGPTTPRERALMNAIPSAELSMVMPPNARLASSGVELSRAKKTVAKQRKP